MKLFGRKKEEEKKFIVNPPPKISKAVAKKSSKKTQNKVSKKSKEENENILILKKLKKSGLPIFDELEAVHKANEIIKMLSRECSILSWPDDLHKKIKDIIKEKI